ncbi:putative serine hydrolase [Saccharomycopsis crataegensis]|uniref:Serine hydrolase n=1 Tax=Saccharomycopsis crataegensis TaxID=43959 RepID=A0AAV5QW65_9ASCO|nr:putative serine hydrolase [Saccharomycopsis crataegensis]
MSATAVPTRVLCLHGFAQTGPVFSAKSSGFRKMLKKSKIETLYLDGPVNLTAEDLPFDASGLGADGNDFKSWWYNIDDFNIDPAIETVKSYIKEHGPFDGILGFSQGAAFAQLITNNMESLGNTKPVKFAVYFSGYVTKNLPVNEKYLANKIEIPTLHVMGEQDTVVGNDRSMEFVEKYTKPGTATVFKHPGGHYVPNQKPVVKQWTEWVMNALSDEPKKPDETPETPSKPAEKSVEDELEELGKGIDNLGTA